MDNPGTGCSIPESVPPPVVYCVRVIGEGSDSDIEVDYQDYNLDLDADRDLLAELRRNDRKSRAKFFRMDYTVGSSWEKKTYIWSGGGFFGRDKSTGIKWVGVHGTDSICVVTKAGDLDVTRVHGPLVYETMEAALCKFRTSVISEIEDFADPLSIQSKVVGQSIEKPFGVVSGIPCFDKIDHEAPSDDENRENDIIIKPFWYDEEKSIKYLQEKRKNALLTSSETTQASSVEYDDRKAIEYLKDKMISKTDFTLKETIQTAIRAFQHLFQTEFEASEIEVSVVDLSLMGQEAERKDSVQELELSEIKDHLAVINRPSSLGPSWSEITCVKESKKSGAELVRTCADCMKDGYTEVGLKELEMKGIQEHLAGMKELVMGGSRMTIEII